MYIKEMKQRQEAEEELSQQKKEKESLKQAILMLQNELDWYRYHSNENANALQEANQQKHLLEHRISEYNKVKRERDDAVKEARGMRMEKELTAPCAYVAISKYDSHIKPKQTIEPRHLFPHQPLDKKLTLSTTAMWLFISAGSNRYRNSREVRRRSVFTFLPLLTYLLLLPIAAIHVRGTIKI